MVIEPPSRVFQPIGVSRRQHRSDRLRPHALAHARGSSALARAWTSNSEPDDEEQRPASERDAPPTTRTGQVVRPDDRGETDPGRGQRHEPRQPAAAPRAYGGEGGQNSENNAESGRRCSRSPTRPCSPVARSPWRTAYTAQRHRGGDGQCQQDHAGTGTNPQKLTGGAACSNINGSNHKATVVSADRTGVSSGGEDRDTAVRHRSSPPNRATTDLERDDRAAPGPADAEDAADARATSTRTRSTYPKRSSEATCAEDQRHHALAPSTAPTIPAARTRHGWSSTRHRGQRRSSSASVGSLRATRISMRRTVADHGPGGQRHRSRPRQEHSVAPNRRNPAATSD